MPPAAEPSARAAHQRAWLWPLLLTASLLTVSGLHVTPELPGLRLVSLDKLAHVLYYGLLATLVLRLPTLKVGFHRALLACLCTVFVGLADEWRQSMNPARSFEVADALADVLGTVIAIQLYRLWPAYRNFLEAPVRRRASNRP